VRPWCALQRVSHAGGLGKYLPGVDFSPSRASKWRYRRFGFQRDLRGNIEAHCAAQAETSRESHDAIDSN
jgi:hypothetical protein